MAGAASPATDARALNVKAVLDLTRRLVPPMVARGRGAVVNVVSTSAFQAVPYCGGARLSGLPGRAAG